MGEAGGERDDHCSIDSIDCGKMDEKGEISSWFWFFPSSKLSTGITSYEGAIRVIVGSAIVVEIGSDLAESETPASSSFFLEFRISGEDVRARPLSKRHLLLEIFPFSCGTSNMGVIRILAQDSAGVNSCMLENLSLQLQLK